MHQVASRCPRELAPFGAHRSSLGESESGGVVGSATRTHRPSSAGNDRHNRQERRDGPNPPPPPPPPPPLEYGPRTHSAQAQVARCFRPRIIRVLAGTCIAQEGRENASPRVLVVEWNPWNLMPHHRSVRGGGDGMGWDGSVWELTNVRRQCPESRARRQATQGSPRLLRVRVEFRKRRRAYGACCSL